MNFEQLMEHLAELVIFVKPVGSLVSDFYQAIIINIPEFEMLFGVGKLVLIIIGVVYLFYRAAN